MRYYRISVNTPYGKEACYYFSKPNSKTLTDCLDLMDKCVEEHVERKYKDNRILDNSYGSIVEILKDEFLNWIHPKDRKEVFVILPERNN